MEVRIRREMDAKSSHLTNARISDCDVVITTVREWGLAGDDEGNCLTGSFVVEAEEGAGAYFEITISAAE
jgi:hypothetical protein